MFNFFKKKNEDDGAKVTLAKEMDENWRCYFVCPGCGNYCISKFVTPNFGIVVDFDTTGCCVKCGTMRSKWGEWALRFYMGKVHVKCEVNDPRNNKKTWEYLSKIKYPGGLNANIRPK